MILIIEDNEILAENIQLILNANNFPAKYVTSAEEAEKKLKNTTFNLIILDINLPGKNGFEFLKQLRQQSNIPVLILTSKSLSEDKVKGLELGADDYITKPFDIPEFLARVKVLLKRTVTNNTQNYIQIKNLLIYPDKEKILKGKIEIGLSSLEFKLLMYFIKNKGKILNRKKIYEDVWGEFDNYMFSRTVDVYIANLRKKLGKELIKTKKGSGYYLDF